MNFRVQFYLAEISLDNLRDKFLEYDVRNILDFLSLVFVNNVIGRETCFKVLFKKLRGNGDFDLLGKSLVLREKYPSLEFF